MTPVITAIISMTLTSIARMAVKSMTYFPQRCMKAAQHTYTGRRPVRIQSLGPSRVQTTKFILYLFGHKLTILLQRVLECGDSLGKCVGSLLLALQEVEPVRKQNDGGHGPVQSKTNSLEVLSCQSGHRSVTIGIPIAKPIPKTTFLSVHTPSHYRFPRPKNLDDESNTSELVPCTPYSDTISTSPSANTSESYPTYRTASSANPDTALSRSSIAPCAKKSLADDRLASFDRQDAFMSTLSLYEQRGEGNIYCGSALGGSLFAIKLTKREKTPEHDSLLQGEINAMEKAISSVWTARLRYWQCSKDYLLIAMPFFTGGSIYSYAKAKRIVDADLAVFWTAEILLGLHSLHTLGIVHRGIKPENIMLTGSGHIKIIDFSLAKLFDHDSVSKERFPLFHSLREAGSDLFPQIWALPSNPHTTNGGLGTPGFSPPEVWLRKRYSYGVDYFAMACILYELLTDYLPYTYDPVAGDYDVLDINVDPNNVLTNVQRNFLQKVLMPNPVLRPSVAHMKKHPLFKNINWKALSRHEVPPPTSFRSQSR